MLYVRRWGILLMVPALAYVLAAAGCGSDKGKDVPRTGTGGSRPSAVSTARDSDSGSSNVEATALEAKGEATVKGKVTYDGTPPAPDDLTKQMELQGKDKAHCLKGPTKDPLWLVGADKGVENVVVWLKAPAGKYFKIPADQRSHGGVVTIDQPFCMFQPHVAAINPSVWDPEAKKQVKTGQTFKVLNSAPITHNTAYKGSPLLNPGTNQNLPSRGEMPITAKPCKDGDFGKEELLNVNCDIHKWMTAKVAVFDHPYYAVTDKDGNYEIKNAPAGAELTIHVWHESMNPTSLKNVQSKPVTLKDGTNTEDFKIK